MPPLLPTTRPAQKIVPYEALAPLCLVGALKVGRQLTELVCFFLIRKFWASCLPVTKKASAECCSAAFKLHEEVQWRVILWDYPWWSSLPSLSDRVGHPCLGPSFPWFSFIVLGPGLRRCQVPALLLRWPMVMVQSLSCEAMTKPPEPRVGALAFSWRKIQRRH